ncbi:caspase family protein [Brasilonema sp. UFV-L1]|uniref:caspase family protein n=1 Tax=Brasilonema sp. UFV-L1 TaxID=2234130 RepID=UPI00145CF43B|nr:caspase family protein [Brasilonema sp. UFV-L1]NMG08869.1 peptidase C14 [Brasilonema sp. UFV-L1]
MSPLGIGSSDSTHTLTTGEAKLWILLVGVNEYQDENLPSLRYPALDCQGLGKALSSATKGFPNKEVIVHHDFAPQPPTLETIRRSLQQIVSQSQSQDSILLYFSGHGMLEPNTQQSVLCLADTHKNDLLATGLGMQDLVRILGASPANQQLVCLDTCHSGDMRLLGNRGSARDGDISESSLNSTTQMMDVLRQRAAQSKGFCALLSCDQGQKSWEFPELGHGLFTYYLMQGLLGEAADSHGLIEADRLYKYVYRQTLQYINNLNQQLRLINQQKLERGDSKLHPEYPLQTPKRIVEGVGELIVGFQSVKAESQKARRAVVIDGLSNKKATTDLSRLFAGAGGFEVDYFPQKGKNWSEIRGTIQGLTRWRGESEIKSSSQCGIARNPPTSLFYLRGQIEEIEDGEAWLILGDGVRLSRSWLRQELRRAQKSQQIIILDFIVSDSSISTSVENWIEDLQCEIEHGQCIIAAATPPQKPELFSQTLLETLVTANPQVGLPVAKWMTQLKTLLQSKGINVHVWLSGTQAVIDILPGNIATIFQDLPGVEIFEVQRNKQQQKEQKENLLPISPSSTPVSTLGVHESSATKQSKLKFSLSSEQYTNLEQLLKQSIGPIASLILQQAVAQAANCQELVRLLANYLLPQQQKQFEKQAIALLEASTVSSQNQSAQSPNKENQTIDANFISKCERELAYSIGPIANFLIKQVLQSQPQISLSEFVNKLAQRIPEPKQASEFKRRMLG